jgi:DnaJ-like protein
MENWESPVEKAIREAQERGEFDNLPGTGKPLRSLGDPEREDPDWWVRSLAEREHLDLSGALSPPLALRKEAATFPGSLLDLRTEASVRAVLEDYNHRVKTDRLRPGVGSSFPIWAPLVDVDDMVEQWRELRETDRSAASSQAAEVTAPAASGGARLGRASWIRRLLGRSRGS